MIRLKKVMLGFVCGVLLSACTAVYADDVVEALLVPLRVSVNGEAKRLGDEYRVLNYDGHVYLPARFVVETLGGQVFYDEQERKLSIVDPKLPDRADWQQQAKVLMELASGERLEPAARLIDSYSGEERDRLFLEVAKTMFQYADKPHMAELLQLFADRKVNLEVRDDKSGYTPLLFLAERSPAYIPVLLDAGANVNAAGVRGDTALMRIAGKGMPELVRAMLQKGADPNAQVLGGYTPLRAAALPMFTNYRKETAETVALLLAAGAKVNVVDADGTTPLLVASEFGEMSEPVVRLLLDHGADVKLADSEGRTALHRSAKGGGSPELIAMMIRLGAPADGKDKEGNTPLAYAVDRAGSVIPENLENCREVIRLLIGAGADPAAPNAQGVSPRDRAAALEDEQRRELVLGWLQ
ncbi:ankyrin repeat domain-containing protein [Paenibacillus hamazuiensis]|uniref:ankyrin repeat domain-containing protein n=1 Tax=Paenibacillus hamazuiensis TaxID=2936508 RepID=UPI00200F49F8|nr:ankyrin repeat domain-containing protein [Paenibacillus hamazuiensis]